MYSPGIPGNHGNTCPGDTHHPGVILSQELRCNERDANPADQVAQEHPGGARGFPEQPRGEHDDSNHEDNRGEESQPHALQPDTCGVVHFSPGRSNSERQGYRCQDRQ